MITIKTRRLISWISFFSFAVLGITGLVMYFTPQGRISNWADWYFLGLAKEDWSNIHIIVSMLFLVTAIWHIYLNWKPLVNYLKNTHKQISFIKPDFIIALIITIVFSLGAYFHLPPFSLALNGLEKVKNYWEDEYGSPPWGHAELASIKVFCTKMNFDLESSIELLKSEGFKDVSTKINLKNFASANNTSPKAILDLLKTKTKKINDRQSDNDKSRGASALSGLGRMTLEHMCQKAGIGIDKAIKRLAKKADIQATPNMKVKEIAERTGETPMDIWNMIQNKGN
ncbi:MAG: DUF4405 domain-containing protein [Desulfobacula sp.]|uniref:DUF4405 domain-containing protein n=1 Tax=Desulfobacula sp. TaxID=2593537 RepID=UPI0025BCAC1A|nr:DUF4405 domain-containing protein [Desulfobacula sp.]MCD4719416.1 DUF4405 domain-containing protein [Desulfobacula sp.]